MLPVTSFLFCMPHQLFTANEDFISQTEEVVFHSSTTLTHQSWCTNVTLIDDYAVETVEYFTVALSTSDQSVDLLPDIANITVTDGDGGLLSCQYIICIARVCVPVISAVESNTYTIP